MDIEEVERVYKQEIDDAESEFLKGLQSGGDKEKITTVYRTKLKQSRDKYYSMSVQAMDAIVKSQQQKAFAATKVRKKELNPMFKANWGKLELNRRQKLAFKYDMLKFQWRVKFRKALHRVVPVGVFYQYFKMKYVFKSTVKSTRRGWERLVLKLKTRFGEFLNWAQELGVKIYKKVLGWIRYPIDKITHWYQERKKKKEEEKKKAEEEKKKAEEAKQEAENNAEAAAAEGSENPASGDAEKKEGTKEEKSESSEGKKDEKSADKADGKTSEDSGKKEAVKEKSAS